MDGYGFGLLLRSLAEGSHLCYVAQCIFCDIQVRRSGGEGVKSANYL